MIRVSSVMRAPSRGTLKSTRRNTRFPARSTCSTLTFANAAYHELARTLGRKTSEAEPAEVVPPPRTATRGVAAMVTLGEAGSFELAEVPVAGGWAGTL